MKRIQFFLILLVMLTGNLISASAQENDWSPFPYGIWIGGRDIVSEDASVFGVDDTYSHNGINDTLTLATDESLITLVLVSLDRESAYLAHTDRRAMLAWLAENTPSEYGEETWTGSLAVLQRDLWAYNEDLMATIAEVDGQTRLNISLYGDILLHVPGLENQRGDIVLSHKHRAKMILWLSEYGEAMEESFVAATEVIQEDSRPRYQILIPSDELYVKTVHDQNNQWIGTVFWHPGREQYILEGSFWHRTDQDPTNAALIFVDEYTPVLVLDTEGVMSLDFAQTMAEDALAGVTPPDSHVFP